MSAAGKEWLTRKEAAIYLSGIGCLVQPRTLARLASRGEGPPYRRTLERIAAYSKADLSKWAKDNTRDISAVELEKKRRARLSAA